MRKPFSVDQESEVTGWGLPKVEPNVAGWGWQGGLAAGSCTFCPPFCPAPPCPEALQRLLGAETSPHTMICTGHLHRSGKTRSPTLLSLHMVRGWGVDR